MRFKVRRSIIKLNFNEISKWNFVAIVISIIPFILIKHNNNNTKNNNNNNNNNNNKSVKFASKFRDSVSKGNEIQFEQWDCMKIMFHLPKFIESLIIWHHYYNF
jgi:hypothetical protein